MEISNESLRLQNIPVWERGLVRQKFPDGWRPTLENVAQFIETDTRQGLNFNTWARRFLSPASYGEYVIERSFIHSQAMQICKRETDEWGHYYMWDKTKSAVAARKFKREAKAHLFVKLWERDQLNQEKPASTT
jgi:hypothetical protein